MRAALGYVLVPLSLWLAGLLPPARLAIGQPTADPAPGETVLPQQRAADDAFQNFVDKVLTLRLERAPDGGLETELTVAELLILPAGPPGMPPEEAIILPERELRRALLAACEHSNPRPTAGGGVELDVWLPTSRLNEVLKSIVAAYLPKVDRARAVLRSATGPMVTATGRYIPDGRPRDDRPGWRQCTPDQIAQTRLAVELDVRRRLFDRIGAMRVTDARRLRDVQGDFPLFREAIRRRVQAVRLSEPVFEPTGVCRLELSISRAELRALVQTAAADSKEKLPPEVAEVNPGGSDPIMVEGFAVPPPYTPPPSRTRPVAEPDRPEWADRVFKAQATGSPPPGVADEQARRDLAHKAARLEASRQIWLAIEGLPLGDATLGEALARHPRRAEIAAAIETLMVPISSPVSEAEGQVTVTLHLRLDPLWRMVRDLR